MVKHSHEKPVHNPTHTLHLSPTRLNIKLYKLFVPSSFLSRAMTEWPSHNLKLKKNLTQSSGILNSQEKDSWNHLQPFLGETQITIPEFQLGFRFSPRFDKTRKCSFTLNFPATLLVQEDFLGAAKFDLGGVAKFLWLFLAYRVVVMLSIRLRVQASRGCKDRLDFGKGPSGGAVP